MENEPRGRRTILFLTIVLLLHFRQERPIVARPRHVHDAHAVVPREPHVLGRNDVPRLAKEMLVRAETLVPLLQAVHERYPDFVPEGIRVSLAAGAGKRRSAHREIHSSRGRAEEPAG